MSSSEQLIYENRALMFSVLHARDLGMVMKWKPYKLRICKIFSTGKSGHFFYAYPKSENDVPKRHMFHVDSNMELELTCRDDDDPEAAFSEQVLTVKCRRMDDIDSMFRCIGTPDEINRVIIALNAAAGNKSKGTGVDKRSYFPRDSASKRQGFASAINSVVDRARGANVMRRAIHIAMDSHDALSRKMKVLSQRGAFQWLPVSGANDLTHGSWWLVWGSVGIVITGAVVIINKYHLFLSDDDSTLPLRDFIASWVLMCISGVFSTLGSLAFVRAFHTDPPMRPVFANLYHLQSDELLASWLFVGATCPFIPYSLIFVAQSHYHSLIYILALAFAIVATFGSLVFVRACYPSDKGYQNLLLPISKYIFCCASEKWRQNHFANDWIGGSWLFYWCSLAGTFVNFILFIYTLTLEDPLLIFVFGTSLLEMVFFLVGCAYYVAGSSSPDMAHARASEDHVTTVHSNSKKTREKNYTHDQDDDDDDDEDEETEREENPMNNASSWSSAMNPVREANAK